MPEVGVDFPHMLENYARMYNSGSELVVGEAIGNAVDEGSTKMDMTLQIIITLLGLLKHLVKVWGLPELVENYI